MTREERDKTIRILQWLHDNNFLFRSTEEDVKFATEYAIKALKQESMLEKIKADLEKLANDEWNTKVGSVSQGLECALEIIEAYQEGR